MANLELLVTLLRAVGARDPSSCWSATPTSSPRSAPASRSPSWWRSRPGAGHAADPHLPPGGGVDDRAGRPRDPPRRVPRFRAGRGDAPRSVPDRAPDAPAPRCEEIVVARRASGSRPITGSIRSRHPGVRAGLPGRARDRRPQRGAAGRRSTRTARPVRGGRLRIGDKLMMTGRNLHELGLMNGTLLRLLDEVGGRRRGRGRRAGRGAHPGRRRGRSSGCPPRRPTGWSRPTRARCTAARGSSCRWR